MHAVELLRAAFVDADDADRAAVVANEAEEIARADDSDDVRQWLVPLPQMHLKRSQVYFKGADGVLTHVGVTSSMGQTAMGPSPYFQAKCAYPHRGGGGKCSMFLKYAYDPKGCDTVLRNWLVHAKLEDLTAVEHGELGKKLRHDIQEYWESLVQ